VTGGAEFILIGGALLLAAIGTSLVASRLRLPGLLLFLAVGMAVGSDGAGWIQFSDYHLAAQVGTAALALILFDGGLSARTDELRKVVATSLRLAVVGTVITAIVTGVVAATLFGASIIKGLLLGSILAATDTAAVFGVLRASSLRRRIGATLEGEAGLNDPVAVLLVIGFMNWIQRPDYGLVDMLALFAKEAVIGVGCGMLVGRLAARALASIRLPTAGLYPVAALGAAGVAFGSAQSLGGSGFLAVYLTGVLMASGSIQARQTITSFHEGLAWLAQITLFMTLGLLVSPGQLGSVAGDAILVALALMLLARPMAVVIATMRDGFSPEERLLLSWAGLRGAVPVVLATFPVIEGIPGSAMFFDIVFFTVVISTAVQGSTFERLAHRLGLTTAEPPLPRALAEFGTIRGLGAELVEYPVTAMDPIVGRRVADLWLPQEASLNVIVRGDEAVPPRDATQIRAGDTLHLLVREEVAGLIPELLERWSGHVWDGEAAVGVAAPDGLVTRPWMAADGDPSDPEMVAGALVVERLRERADQAGALVLLENGQLAVTGPSVAVGNLGMVRRYAGVRLGLADDRAEQGWWREVTTALRAVPV
jgi:cell volume regulation protein A